MIDDKNVTDGKIKINGLLHQYLENKNAKITVDTEGKINFEGDDLPKTSEEWNNAILELFLSDLETKTEKEMLELLESVVEVEVLPATKYITRPPVIEIEPINSEPEPESEPKLEEQEGFFTSYYNWIFGIKKEEKLEPIKISHPTLR